jgi:hypothetical protein
VALMNPFGDDAIVDFTFLTSSGVQAPDIARAVVVARHSRVSVPLHDILRDQDLFGFQIHARIGRVVAEQSIFLPASTGSTGLATSLGATGFASTWRVPSGDAETGAAANLAVANFTNAATGADIRVIPDQGLPPVATKVSVPSMSVSLVDVGKNVPAGTGYSVTISTGRRSPVVAEFVQSWAPPVTVPGFTTALAAATTARAWAFAVGRLDATGDTQLAAMNPSRRSVTVDLLSGAGGRLGPVSSARVAPGHRATFPLGSAGVAPDQVVVLRADGPIVAGRLALGAAAAVSLGFPQLG